MSLMSPALAGRFLTTSAPWEALLCSVAQSYLTFWDPMVYPHQAPLSMEISQAIILECFTIGHTVSVLFQSGFIFFTL